MNSGINSPNSEGAEDSKRPRLARRPPYAASTIASELRSREPIQYALRSRGRASSQESSSGDIRVSNRGGSRMDTRHRSSTPSTTRDPTTAPRTLPIGTVQSVHYEQTALCDKDNYVSESFEHRHGSSSMSEYGHALVETPTETNHSQRRRPNTPKVIASENSNANNSSPGGPETHIRHRAFFLERRSYEGLETLQQRIDKLRMTDYEFQGRSS
ncbi:hypothetical protein N7462_002706 [Penicillium macrosclerotiorum]|uniref:uncharacterized protein n=1 Tax=Penicillium macrosclerotiorum TaxID=303699 RepID=UPI0025469C7C|nr:uncharacterized protein N7462_002706 [Penicillium macrosclerotiorum]KAJ5693283.1 hypothetical protein N7462_002706 [Penicillium macrosclerotiorum]